MRKHSLPALYAKLLLLSLPFFFLLIYYVAKDPFQVLRQYSDYDHNRVAQNEGMIGWIKYKRYNSVRHYDSFIMGNSCTKAFQSADWLQYVSGSPLRFFANSEDLDGLTEKLEALDRQPGQQIRNLLIVLEPASFNSAHNDFMHIMPPDVSHKSESTFQMAFMQGFFSPRFLLPYLRYTVGHCSADKLRGIINADIPTREKYTNDAILHTESKISAMGENYWHQGTWKKQLSKQRVPQVMAPIYQPEQLEQWEEIRAICLHHHTNLKIVIGPSFDRKIMNSKDVRTLQSIFGSGVVYDFSSPRFFWMDDYHNFYDTSHYRRQLGQKILGMIYGSNR